MSKYTSKLALLLTGFMTLGSLSSSIAMTKEDEEAIKEEAKKEAEGFFNEMLAPQFKSLMGGFQSELLGMSNSLKELDKNLDDRINNINNVLDEKAMKGAFEISHPDNFSVDSTDNLHHGILGDLSKIRLLSMMNSAVDSCYMISTKNDFGRVLKKVNEGCKIYRTPSGMLVTSTLNPITWLSMSGSKYCYLSQDINSEYINYIPEHPVFEEGHKGEEIWVINYDGELSNSPCAVLRIWEENGQPRIRFLQICEDDQSKTVQVKWLKQSEWQKLIDIDGKENEKSRLLFRLRVFENFNKVVDDVSSVNRTFIGVKEDGNPETMRKKLNKLFLRLYKDWTIKKFPNGGFNGITQDTSCGDVVNILKIKGTSDLYGRFFSFRMNLNYPMEDIRLIDLQKSEKTVTVIES